MSEIQHWQIDNIAVIEDKDFLTDAQKDFIDNVVTSTDTDIFPYYVRTKPTNNGSMVGLFHRVMEPDFNSTTKSAYYDEFEDILETFCSKHSIRYSMMIRCAVNLVFNDGSDESAVHTDHDCDHKSLIVYLNDPLDANSHTHVFDDRNNMIHSCNPEKNKALYFAKDDNTPVKHGVTMPQTGHRYTLIFTFI